MKKQIFGKTYNFECESMFDALLNESLCLYPDSLENKTDVSISISSSLKEKKIISSNPDKYKKTNYGMINDFGLATVCWKNISLDSIDIDLVIYKKSKINKFLNRVKSIDYASEVERFEQILYELVLVPSVYFFDDIAPIHAASIVISGKTILLAGTGGVGKSGAMLSLRDCKDASFQSDDISIVSENSYAYGNMAWPKIYGYHCKGNNIIKEILFGRSFLDIIHFHIKNKINPARVRRKIRPEKLFRSVAAEKVPISSLVYIVKENVYNATISKLSLQDAVEMSVSVLHTEYSVFHNFIYWDNYNSIALGISPLITMKKVTNNLKDILRKSFKPINIFKLSIPLEISHSEYQRKIREVVLSEKI